MKILAIPASNSRQGINRRLLGHAAELLEGGLVAEAEVQLLDLNEFEMPIFSIERLDRDGIPDEAKRFYHAIGEADAVIVSFAEHNGSYTVAWKNVYDWASRVDMKVYQGKKVAMFATSPGARGGRTVLDHAVLTAPFFGAEVVGSLSIPSFGQSFDSTSGALADPELAAQFEKVLGALG